MKTPFINKTARIAAAFAPVTFLAGATLLLVLCALAQGKAVASAAEAIARNPGAAAVIRGTLLLGLVLIESLALYTLVIIFAKV